MLRAVRRLTIYVGNDVAGGARAAAMSGVANSPRIDDRLPNLGTVTAPGARRQAGLNGGQSSGTAAPRYPFVLGHIDYYPRAGFRPALPLGLRAPYAIDSAVADAWMVRETRPGLLGAVRGTVQCADALMHPALWRE